jgi:hypothetical protein
VAARGPSQLGQSISGRNARPTESRLGHPAEGISNGQDAAELRDLMAGQSHRVTTAVDALVMMQDPVQCLERQSDVADDLQAPDRMLTVVALFIGGQRPGPPRHRQRQPGHADVE